MRPTLLATALTLLVAAPLAWGQQDLKLPDIGSSAGELLTPARQEEYGAMTLRELRNYGYLLDDPLVSDWLSDLGRRLGAKSDRPEQKFTFFTLRDRQINAFATLGGYIGMNSGLVLAAEREDEVAAVLAHEIAHVTQQHVLRGVERAQRDQVPILLGMLGAIVAAQAAGGRSSGDATQAALASAMGLMAQRQIDYTRSNESEADRVGIYTLERAGYDPEAMAAFFERLQLAMRSNMGSGRDQYPDYLQTHPVTTTRISESRQRAEQIERGKRTTTTVRTPGGKVTESIPQEGDYASGRAPGLIPAAPFDYTLVAGNAKAGSSGLFALAKERLRVLSADTPNAAIREYLGIQRGKGSLTDAQRYGLALAQLRDNQVQVAEQTLGELLAEDPDNPWLIIALAQAELRGGKPAAANKRMDALLARDASDRPVALSYADLLNEQGTAAAGKRAQAILRPLQASAGDDPLFQQAYARANELAGEATRAAEAYAEVAFLNGRPEQALLQLQTLKQRQDLDYYTRARVDARIASITPQVLELRRLGVRDEVLDRR
ncbi:M48 family metalloprotease [Pseudoxanthomonas composti]|uniref:Putative beta-barrel assembly-enhancing protease n=1 Tax=Pseudoxanthomonas composti TaxID=2137479 RepID=A0A4Q1JVM6_9GAMM|nr:M48 family metalloprotease [Pseudoxanthomonas composti]RXR05229.1 M48 family peptidase [Pseudoxanthomonas composti]